MATSPSSRLRPSHPDEGRAIVMDRNELLTRLEDLMLRRANPRPDVLYLHSANLVIYPAEHLVKWWGQPLPLSPKEFDLLLLMARYPGKALSRDFLLNTLGCKEFAGEGRLVDCHIMRLRRKLGDGARLIETVKGVGYRLCLPVPVFSKG